MPVARKRLDARKVQVNSSKEAGVGVRAMQADATRDALVRSARALFTDRGYHDVGIRELTAAAGVTRGAFYHHFGDKESLFLAVFDAVERDMTPAPDTPRGKGSDDVWAQFRNGIQDYLDAAMRPDVQRITLVEAPAVLGWERWRKLEEGYGLGAITRALDAAMKAKLIRRQPVEPLAHLLLGSVMEAAMLIAHSERPAQRRVEVGKALDSVLRGLM